VDRGSYDEVSTPEAYLIMLQPNTLVPLSEAERQFFTELVPEDHFLRRLPQVVDFERFRPILASVYCDHDGRPPFDPVFMLKLEILARHYRLSDRELMKQAQVNIAFRLFLELGRKSPLPHHTSMTYFRERVGTERMPEIFHVVLGQARELGLLKTRLRLKDATHVLANIAVPSTIRLVADTRQALLAALRPFAAERVDQETQRAEEIRVASDDLPDQERLLRRVTHLRAILAWADDVPATAVFRAAEAARQDKLHEALALAHKVLADRDDPQAGDKVLSTHDPDARRGMHGDFYDGYLVDVAMDADSELITGINILPANGDEGGDAAYLIEQEEAAQGHDIDTVSIDGAGYRGSVLRELTDPNGLNLEVITPPSERIPLTVFGPEQFMLSADGQMLTCPAGQTTTQHERNQHDTGEKFRFSKRQCGGCTMREQCLSKPETKCRTVTKTDYEAEYRAARAKAETPEYARVRKEHPAIERKLSEMVNRHGMRAARYRGLPKVKRQAWLTALVVNLKRMVRLVIDPDPGWLGMGRVRAELAVVS
jgi:transposase